MQPDQAVSVVRDDGPPASLSPMEDPLAMELALLRNNHVDSDDDDDNLNDDDLNDSQYVYGQPPSPCNDPLAMELDLLRTNHADSSDNDDDDDLMSEPAPICPTRKRVTTTTTTIITNGDGDNHTHNNDHNHDDTSRNDSLEKPHQEFAEFAAPDPTQQQQQQQQEAVWVLPRCIQAKDDDDDNENDLGLVRPLSHSNPVKEEPDIDDDHDDDDPTETSRHQPTAALLDAPVMTKLVLSLAVDPAITTTTTTTTTTTITTTNQSNDHSMTATATKTALHHHRKNTNDDDTNNNNDNDDTGSDCHTRASTRSSTEATAASTAAAAAAAAVEADAQTDANLRRLLAFEQHVNTAISQEGPVHYAEDGSHSSCDSRQHSPVSAVAAFQALIDATFEDTSLRNKKQPHHEIGNDSDSHTKSSHMSSLAKLQWEMASHDDHGFLLDHVLCRRDVNHHDDPYDNDSNFLSSKDSSPCPERMAQAMMPSCPMFHDRDAANMKDINIPDLPVTDGEPSSAATTTTATTTPLVSTNGDSHLVETYESEAVSPMGSLPYSASLGNSTDERSLCDECVAAAAANGDDDDDNDAAAAAPAPMPPNQVLSSQPAELLASTGDHPVTTVLLAAPPHKATNPSMTVPSAHLESGPTCDRRTNELQPPIGGQTVPSCIDDNDDDITASQLLMVSQDEATPTQRAERDGIDMDAEGAVSSKDPADDLDPVPPTEEASMGYQSAAVTDEEFRSWNGAALDFSGSRQHVEMNEHDLGEPLKADKIAEGASVAPHAEIVEWDDTVQYKQDIAADVAAPDESSLGGVIATESNLAVQGTDAVAVDVATPHDDEVLFNEEACHMPHIDNVQTVDNEQHMNHLSVKVVASPDYFPIRTEIVMEKGMAGQAVVPQETNTFAARDRAEMDLAGKAGEDMIKEGPIASECSNLVPVSCSVARVIDHSEMEFSDKAPELDFVTDEADNADMDSLKVTSACEDVMEDNQTSDNLSAEIRAENANVEASVGEYAVDSTTVKCENSTMQAREEAAIEEVLETERLARHSGENDLSLNPEMEFEAMQAVATGDLIDAISFKQHVAAQAAAKAKLGNLSGCDEICSDEVSRQATLIFKAGIEDSVVDTTAVASDFDQKLYAPEKVEALEAQFEASDGEMLSEKNSLSECGRSRHLQNAVEVQQLGDGKEVGASISPTAEWPLAVDTHDLRRTSNDAYVPTRSPRVDVAVQTEEIRGVPLCSLSNVTEQHILESVNNVTMLDAAVTDGADMGAFEDDFSTQHAAEKKLDPGSDCKQICADVASGQATMNFKAISEADIFNPANTVSSNEPNSSDDVQQYAASDSAEGVMADHEQMESTNAYVGVETSDLIKDDDSEINFLGNGAVSKHVALSEDDKVVSARQFLPGETQLDLFVSKDVPDENAAAGVPDSKSVGLNVDTISLSSRTSTAINPDIYGKETKLLNGTDQSEEKSSGALKSPCPERSDDVSETSTGTLSDELRPHCPPEQAAVEEEQPVYSTLASKHQRFVEGEKHINDERWAAIRGGKPLLSPNAGLCSVNQAELVDSMDRQYDRRPAFASAVGRRRPSDPPGITLACNLDDGTDTIANYQTFDWYALPGTASHHFLPPVLDLYAPCSSVTSGCGGVANPARVKVKNGISILAKNECRTEVTHLKYMSGRAFNGLDEVVAVSATSSTSSAQEERLNSRKPALDMTQETEDLTTVESENEKGTKPFNSIEASVSKEISDATSQYFDDSDDRAALDRILDEIVQDVGQQKFVSRNEQMTALQTVQAEDYREGEVTDDRTTAEHQEAVSFELTKVLVDMDDQVEEALLKSTLIESEDEDHSSVGERNFTASLDQDDDNLGVWEQDFVTHVPVEVEVSKDKPLEPTVPHESKRESCPAEEIAPSLDEDEHDLGSSKQPPESQGRDEVTETIFAVMDLVVEVEKPRWTDDLTHDDDQQQQLEEHEIAGSIINECTLQGPIRQGDLPSYDQSFEEKSCQSCIDEHDDTVEPDTSDGSIQKNEGEKKVQLQLDLSPTAEQESEEMTLEGDSAAKTETVSNVAEVETDDATPSFNKPPAQKSKLWVKVIAAFALFAALMPIHEISGPPAFKEYLMSHHLTLRNALNSSHNMATTWMQPMMNAFNSSQVPVFGIKNNSCPCQSFCVSDMSYGTPIEKLTTPVNLDHLKLDQATIALMKQIPYKDSRNYVLGSFNASSTRSGMPLLLYVCHPEELPPDKTCSN